jgi:glycosidase
MIFGTIKNNGGVRYEEDFDMLLEGVHRRGMRLIMDLVINHTSRSTSGFKMRLRIRVKIFGLLYFS